MSMFFCIDPVSLRLHVRRVPQPGQLAISADYFALRAEMEAWSVKEFLGPGTRVPPLTAIVHWRVQYPLQREQDWVRLRRRVVRYILPPSPELVALAAIMWQGLVAGATWDSIKYAVGRAIDVLRYRVVPSTRTDHLCAAPVSKKRKRALSRTALGISWTKYSQTGKPMHDFFVGLERAYYSMSEKERRAVLRKMKASRSTAGWSQRRSTARKHRGSARQG